MRWLLTCAACLLAVPLVAGQKPLSIKAQVEADLKGRSFVTRVWVGVEFVYHSDVLRGDFSRRVDTQVSPEGQVSFVAYAPDEEYPSHYQTGGMHIFYGGQPLLVNPEQFTQPPACRPPTMSSTPANRAGCRSVSIPPGTQVNIDRLSWDDDKLVLRLSIGYMAPTITFMFGKDFQKSATRQTILTAASHALTLETFEMDRVTTEYDDLKVQLQRAQAAYESAPDDRLKGAELLLLVLDEIEHNRSEKERLAHDTHAGELADYMQQRTALEASVRQLQQDLKRSRGDVPQAPGPIVFPSNTLVAVRTIDAVDSNARASSADYRATVDDSVVVDGVTLAPVGTPAFLRLVETHQAGVVMGRAFVSLRLMALEIDGHRIAVESGEATIRSNSQAASAAKSGTAGAIIGGVVGGLLGGKAGAALGASVGAAGGVAAAAAGGERVKVPVETRLSFVLRARSGDPLLDELVAMESDALDFVKRGDRETIDRALDPSFVMVENGRRISRFDYLVSIKPLAADVEMSATIESPELRLADGVATLSGFATIHIHQGTTARVVRQRFTDVYAWRNGRWFLLSAESTTM